MTHAVVATVVAWWRKVGVVQDGVQVCSGEPREVQVTVGTSRGDGVQLAVGGV